MQLTTIEVEGTRYVPLEQYETLYSEWVSSEHFRTAAEVQVRELNTAYRKLALLLIRLRDIAPHIRGRNNLGCAQLEKLIKHTQEALEE